MEEITGSQSVVPLWLIILALAVIVLLVLVIVIWKIISRKLLITKLTRVLENSELAESLIKSRHSSRYLFNKSGLIERFARKNDPVIIGLIGLDDIYLPSLFGQWGPSVNCVGRRLVSLRQAVGAGRRRGRGLFAVLWRLPSSMREWVAQSRSTS